MAELKPCPFCGEEAKMWQYMTDEWRATCNGCVAQTRYCNTREEAIEAWNRRAGDPDGS